MQTLGVSVGQMLSLSSKASLASRLFIGPRSCLSLKSPMLEEQKAQLTGFGNLGIRMGVEEQAFQPQLPNEFLPLKLDINGGRTSLRIDRLDCRVGQTCPLSLRFQIAKTYLIGRQKLGVCSPTFDGVDGI